MTALRMRGLMALVAILGASWMSVVRAEDAYMGAGLEPAGTGQVVSDEYFDPLSGRLSHEVTELVLPGNGGLDIRITRAFAKNGLPNLRQPYSALDWEISVPRIYLTSSPFRSNYCENPATDYPQGILLSVPGEYPKSLLGTGSSPRYITTDFWKAECTAATAATTGTVYAGRGFLVTSPQGVTYHFDQSFFPGPGAGQLQHVVPSLVADRFGNWIRYEYILDPNGALHVSRIHASDGREVSFAYFNAGTLSVWEKWFSTKDVLLLDNFRVGDRTWKFVYEYSSGKVTSLKKVILPDETYYEYAYGHSNQLFMPFWEFIDRATYPNRSSRSYKYARVQVDGTDIWRVTEKTVAELTRARVTNYAYAAPQSGKRSATITSQGRTERLVVDASTGPFRGRVLERFVLDPNQVEFEQTVHTYQALRRLGGARVKSGAAATNAIENLVVPLSKIIRRGSDRYVTEYRSYNYYGQPEEIRDYFDPDGLWRPARRTTFAFLNDSTLWVLGQVASSQIGLSSESNPQPAGYETASTTFDSLDRPLQIWRNGRLVGTLAYDAQGNLANSTDSLSRQTRWLDYYRGAARTTIYPDESSARIVVNDFGERTSATDENSNITSYQLDKLGRVTLVDYPDGDVQDWVSRATAYGFLASAQFGHPAGTWREKETHGRLERQAFYDGFGQPVHVREQDLDTSRVRSRYFGYDDLGRRTFVGDWVEGETGGLGTYIAYDPLDRVIRRWRSDGRVIEENFYEAGQRLRTRDADGKEANFAYQVFGEPDYSRPTLIESPEGQRTSIARDTLGQPTGVTQSGSYEGTQVTATRELRYDANQRLCARVDPETGTTFLGYDEVSQIRWEARGQSGAGCVIAPPVSAVAFEYDARGRKTEEIYPNPEENVGYTYDPAGNLLTATSTAAVWSYSYNKREMIESETAIVDGRTYTFDQRYDRYGNLESLSTPNRVVPYQPDAWGRPTKVSSYVSGVDYHPNGSPRTYAYGNGLSFSMTLNARQWPELQTTWSGSGVIQKYRYTYSGAGDLLSLEDLHDGVDQATLSYDDLHRLESANGMWGSYTYEYDPLNNIRKRMGSSPLNYVYAATNRLSSVNGAQSRTFSYNDRGDVVGNGIKTFPVNGRGQISSINDGPSYAYDGNGKRIKTTYSDGAVEHFLYNRAGALLHTHTIPAGAVAGTNLYLPPLSELVPTERRAAAPNVCELVENTLPCYTDVVLDAVRFCIQGSSECPVQSAVVEAVRGLVDECAENPAGCVPPVECQQGPYSDQCEVAIGIVEMVLDIISDCAADTASCVTPPPPPPVDPTLVDNLIACAVNPSACLPSVDCPAGPYSEQCHLISNLVTDVLELVQACTDGTPACPASAPIPPPTPEDTRPGSDTEPGPTMGSNTVQFTWSESSRATSYDIIVQDRSSGDSVVNTSTATPFHAAELNYGSPYGWTVRACNSSGCSEYSSPRYFSTPPEPEVSTDYLMLNGQNLVEVKGATVTFLHPDLLGSPRKATDASGNLRWQEHYDPYGRQLNGAPERVGYTGHVLDSETGFTYMQARFYDPLIGRFLSSDPQGFGAFNPFTFNRYAYANNNPYTFRDPDGELPNFVVGAAIGGSIEIAIQLSTTGEIDPVALARATVVGAATAGLSGVNAIRALEGSISFSTAIGRTATAGGILNAAGSAGENVANGDAQNLRDTGAAFVGGFLGAGAGAGIASFGRNFDSLLNSGNGLLRSLGNTNQALNQTFAKQFAAEATATEAIGGLAADSLGSALDSKLRAPPPLPPPPGNQVPERVR